jgi:predicted aldo/keto reductase-like oxidoreductase
MFSVNPVFDMTPADSDIYELLDDTKIKENFTLRIEPGRAKFYRLCEQQEVSITVMKTLGAGKLLRSDLSPFGTAMTAGQCIHYALTRPAVASVLLGCKSESEVLEAVLYLEQSEEERDYSRIISGGIAADTREVPLCLYCNHCLPCPARIDIAAVTRYTDIAALNEIAIPPTVIQHYKALERRGSDCFECGACEKKCPFKVKVIATMKKAAQIFGI